MGNLNVIENDKTEHLGIFRGHKKENVKNTQEKDQFIKTNFVCLNENRSAWF